MADRMRMIDKAHVGHLAGLLISFDEVTSIIGDLEQADEDDEDQSMGIFVNDETVGCSKAILRTALKAERDKLNETLKTKYGIDILMGK